MKLLIPILFAMAVAQAKVITQAYDTGYDSGMGGDLGSSSGGDYGSSSGGSYGADYETKCTPYFETVHVEKCENYQEKVCYTTQQESCRDVEDQTCRGIISSRQVRQCFNVTELICGLKEQVQFDVVQAIFTVQKCQKVTERVCDTVYVPQFSNKDDFQCIMLRNPSCHAEDRTIVDKTCRTVTTFDCGHAAQAHVGGGDSAMSGDHYGNGGDHYGSGSDSGSGDRYGQSMHYGSDSGSDDYGSSSYGGSECKKSTQTKCYTTPRTVTSQRCEDREEKVCEKMSERVPVPSEKQVCHDEEKKVCELEQRQQPKQIKKYVYTKQCRSVPRRVCESADVKSLVPSCVPIARKQCSYSPVEKCEDIPKQYCYKIAKRVKKQKCETVAKQDNSYGSESVSSSGYE